MIELIIVMVAIGILAAMLYPSFKGLLPVVKDYSAITKAEALNGAMFTYYRRIPGASTNWSGAADDNARYVLLYSAGYLPNAASTLATYTPTGYTYAFPTPLSNTGRVTITGTSGNVSY